ncbi:ComF family protein [Conexibacter woesei]|uniref:Competence protein F n=1 Tax=Conexibacter woesei (strain DSM 14684 / CCUG 47730 / CIP 108061 / JCM 11494 / NBRC 100937 / ID131577) TaxID=469383 RepID=D3F919_CONWI|nr:double zinc ribbon domain-containing protein [Conexibacter woesei]ADB53014.1 competence protein F [Conexibacter woesei DSM 14684]
MSPRRSSLPDLLLRARDELLAAVVPPACASCGHVLARAHQLLCDRCRAELPWLGPARCGCCGLPRPCGPPCPARDAAFSAAWAPLAYDGTARRLVAALKFGGALPVAQLMAAQIAAGAPRELLRDVVLVPVPLHPARRRARGFDQAGRIAGALADRSGLPLVRCLRRGGPATRQLGASRATRRASGRLAITVADAVPPRVLLVDDVHTTGATFDACARALRGAGAAEVAAVAYARALRR